MVEYLQHKITIGADPEMFCTKDGDYIAVQECGITGTKESPQLLPMGGNAQRDNVAVEFATLPADSKIEFVQNIGDTLMDLLDALPEGVDVDIVPSAHFPEAQLTHEECQEFGCDPDMDAWTMKVNDPPEDAGKSTFRSCGGHIHVGYVQGSGNDFLKDIDGKAMTIRLMDCFHGMVATVLDSGEAAVERRTLYGKPGCFRPTEYGVEYRALSNFWIKHPKLVELMYCLTMDVMKVMRDKTFLEILGELGSRNIIDTIISGNAKVAKSIIVGFLMQFMSEESQTLFWECQELVEKGFDYKEEWKEVA